VSRKQDPAEWASVLVPLGKAARDMRREAGLTQDELAKRSGLAISTVARIETGVVNPGFDTLLDLADGLNVERSRTSLGALAVLVDRATRYRSGAR
jgi:transcriptional regulator with XRE-family HTH domain